MIVNLIVLFSYLWPVFFLVDGVIAYYCYNKFKELRENRLARESGEFSYQNEQHWKDLFAFWKNYIGLHLSVKLWIVPFFVVLLLGVVSFALNVAIWIYWTFG